MATKLASVENETHAKTRAPRVTKPKKIAITFSIVNQHGEPCEGVTLPPGARLLVRNIYRDMTEFGDAITDDPGNVPLFAKFTI